MCKQAAIPIAVKSDLVGSGFDMATKHQHKLQVQQSPNAATSSPMAAD